MIPFATTQMHLTSQSIHESIGPSNHHNPALCLLIAIICCDECRYTPQDVSCAQYHDQSVNQLVVDHWHARVVEPCDCVVRSQPVVDAKAEGDCADEHA